MIYYEASVIYVCYKPFHSLGFAKRGVYRTNLEGSLFLGTEQN